MARYFHRTWDAEGEFLGGSGYAVYSMRLSLLETGLSAFLRVQGISSVCPSRKHHYRLNFVLLHFLQDLQGYA